MQRLKSPVYRFPGPGDWVDFKSGSSTCNGVVIDIVKDIKEPGLQVLKSTGEVEKIDLNSVFHIIKKWHRKDRDAPFALKEAEPIRLAEFISSKIKENINQEPLALAERVKQVAAAAQMSRLLNQKKFDAIWCTLNQKRKELSKNLPTIIDFETLYMAAFTNEKPQLLLKAKQLASTYQFLRYPSVISKQRLYACDKIATATWLASPDNIYFEPVDSVDPDRRLDYFVLDESQVNEIKWIRREGSSIGSNLESNDEYLRLLTSCNLPKQQIGTFIKEFIDKIVKTSKFPLEWSASDQIFMKAIQKVANSSQRSAYDPFVQKLIVVLNKNKTFNVDYSDSLYSLQRAALQLYQKLLGMTDQLEFLDQLTTSLVPLASKTSTNPVVDTTALVQRDYYDRPVYIIDDSDAHELDDGISIEHDASGDYWIHVLVADPSSILSIDNLNQLMCKATTIYFPQKSFPMLSGLENASLGNDSSNAVKFSARLGENGDLIDYKVNFATLTNQRKLTYSDLDPLLDSSYTNAFNQSQMLSINRELISRLKTGSTTLKLSIDEVNDLTRLQKLVELHRNFRKTNGFMESDAPSTKIQFNQDKIRVSSNTNSMNSPAKRLVEECMIIANRVAAKFCFSNGIRVPFRGQQSFVDGFEPFSATFTPQKLNPRAMDKVETLKLYENVLFHLKRNQFLRFTDMQQLLLLQTPAVLSTFPIHHSSMGIPGYPSSPIYGKNNADKFNGYVQVTSPLRRCSDLYVHFKIKSLLSSEKSRDSLNFTRDWTHSYNTMKQIKQISTRAYRMYTLEWIRRRENYFKQTRNDLKGEFMENVKNSTGKGLTYKGMVVGSKVVIPEFGNIPITLNSALDSSIEQGEFIDLKIIDIDPALGKIWMSPS